MAARRKNGRFVKGGGRRRSSRSITRRRSSSPARRSRRRSSSSLGGLMPDRTEMGVYGGAGVYGFMESSFVAEDKGIGQQVLSQVPKFVDGAGLAGNTAIAAHLATFFIKGGTAGTLLRDFKRGVTAVAIYKLGRRKGKGASSATSVDGDDDDVEGDDDDVEGDDDDDVGDADASDFYPDG